MKTLTIDEAIDLVPAIGAKEPAKNVSDSYQFVSTSRIIERIQEYGWRITNATSQGRTLYAQHRVTLVHEKDLNADVNNLEGIPRIEMFNSHNLTKRLCFAVGYLRFVCSNGLVIASGPAETIRTKHRFSDDRLSDIMERVSEISERFPVIQNKIGMFQQRTLNEQEQVDYAEFALRGRYLYRKELPKRFQDVNKMTDLLLQSRRPEDEGNTTWQVYNRIQENLVKGIEGLSLPVRGYGDSVRVNQLLWKGAEYTLGFNGKQFQQNLKDLLVKDGKKGKISA
jgi:hypothetical protein